MAESFESRFIKSFSLPQNAVATACPLYPRRRTSPSAIAKSATASFDYLVNARWTRFHDPIPKTNSISRLAMRHGLGCSAVNCIAAHQYKPTLFGDSACCRRKTSDVVTDHQLRSALEALWARRAGTFPFERPRIGRHWNCPLRHRPYRKGTIAPVGRQATTAIRIL